ncbi:hypothetical protein BO70DRAFT_331114 [Aspergillus heteromorphus CBS 117.55]|uniref:Small nuclear ribonucleoprotein Prp3 C-terminal domain-containing protein n=1 Tax=Aspergillus heteromorphus CBS 117.55 TaxID=1448321 RepID=A0A317WTU0_9EURO|nr:uncharacterized protein BO70DRAFT_331114 [Aspergillus heteromorphus CBS 117.55]PWY89231.1 hypothetical protein BO70DRAFT_331114 [Aspergillus heteromorphus CBS 117.55]
MPPPDHQPQPTLLPPDLLESQLSTIDLLTAMFPSTGEIDIPPSSTPIISALQTWCQDPNTPLPSGIPPTIQLAVCAPLAADISKTIPINISIPLQTTDPDPQLPPPWTYTLRQPTWISKAELATLSADMPQDDIFSALEYVQHEASLFLETQQKMNDSLSLTNTPSSGAKRSAEDPLVRVWFYFPSLSTRAKRNDLVNHAPTYSLTGFVLAGKPGVLCLEGASVDVDAYMKFIKTYSWGDIPSHQKKVSERFRETVGVERVFSGMEEITDSLGERGGERANRGDMQALEAWLKGRGLGEAFGEVIF